MLKKGLEKREEGVKKIWEKRYKIVIVLSFFLFSLQALFFALNIKEYLSPDERYHVILSQEYSHTLSKPLNSENTYTIGQIEDTPFLYHWISGRVLNVKDFLFKEVEDLFVLRFFSVVVSLVNLFVAYKIIKLFTKDKLVQTLFIIMLCNTLMFAFISASANYDPLTILFALQSIYWSMELLKKRSIKNLLLLLIFLLLGMLTKISFPPFALIVLLFFFFNEIGHVKEYLVEIKELWKRKEKRPLFLFLSLPFFLLVVLASSLYATNFIKYKSMTPECTQVMDFEDCMKSAEYSFHYNMAEEGLSTEERLSLYWYIPHWIYNMVETNYGILAHSKLNLSYTRFLLYFVVMVASVVLFVRKLKLKNKTHIFLCFLAISYSLVLLFLLNYPTYLSSGIIHSGVQGRYVFPVIVPIYAFASWSLLSIKNRYVRLIIFLLVSVIFVLGNIPFFLRNVTEEWFILDSLGANIIRSIRVL